MGLFVCSKCSCVENTALGWWWSKDSIRLILPDDMKEFEKGHGLCSECLPASADYEDGSGKGKIGTGKWHNKFPKVHIDDFMAGEEGNYHVRVGNQLIYREKGDAKDVIVVHAGRPSVELSPVNARSLVGRNDPCPCGSNKKYKKCCLK